MHPLDLPEGAEGGHRASYGHSRSATDGQSFTAAAVGTAAHVPVILADFTDNPAEASLHSPAAYQSMFFEPDWPHGAGSMRDYYRDQSGGLFDVTGEVTSWLRMPRPYSDYVGSSHGYQLTQPNDWTLVTDAVAAADAQMDFCDSDTDGDGLVDTVFVAHAGAGAEEAGSGIWSIRWQLPSAFATDDTCANGMRVAVKDFVVGPEEHMNKVLGAPGAAERLISIGMWTHEFGHALGLPDLYDTDMSSAGGVGQWDVMGTGAWGFTGARPWRPTPLSAWSKLQLGWATARNVETDMTDVAIPSSDRARSGKFDGVYRLAPGGAAQATEYFLVENREPTGWAADFPGGGLAVWHVDETHGHNDDESRRAVELVQADGLDELGAVGAQRVFADQGDLFPGALGARGVNDTTNPDTKMHSGAASGVAVEMVGDPGEVTTADLYVTPAPDAPPAPPSDLVANSAGSDVTLNWKASPSADPTAYRVYRSMSPSDAFALIGQVDAASSSYVDAGATSASYYYRVRAFNRFESVDSNTAFAAASGDGSSDDAPDGDLGPSYAPRSLRIDVGRKTSGSVASLRSTDGARLSIKADRDRSVYRARYGMRIPVTKSDARSARALTIEIAAASPISGRLKVVRRSGQALTFSIANSKNVHITLLNPAGFVNSKGEIDLSFSSSRRSLFRHTLDLLRISLER